MDARLTRSRNDRMISGVCGGLARYFGIDATIVRLVFVLAVLSGLSPLIYLILWIVMPQEGAATPPPTQSIAGPTEEYRFDPYTGEPIKK